MEYLKDSQSGRTVANVIAAHDDEVHIPHLCTIETTSVLRSLVLRSLITADRACGALDDLEGLAATRHPHEAYLARVWELRNNLSAYDAVYVALAESLRAVLITCDARLARAPIDTVAIELISLDGENAGGGQAGQT